MTFTVRRSCVEGGGKNERVIGTFFWPGFHPKVSFGTSWPYFPRIHLDTSVRLTCNTAYYANLFSFHLFLINRCFSLVQLLPLSNLFISDLLLNNYQTSIFFFFQITTMILNNVEIFKKNIFELKLKINFEMSSLIIFELNSNIENYEKICNYVENKNASQC